MKKQKQMCETLGRVEHTHTHTQLLSTKGGYNVVSFLKGGVNL